MRSVSKQGHPLQPQLFTQRQGHQAHNCKIGHVETQTMQTADCADRVDCAD